VFRRSLDRPAEVSYYLSNADEETTLEELALVISTRWRVEEYFGDAKKHLGMADYETLAWTSWHHHMAVRVLQSAFARDHCTEDDAFSIIEYHLRRNQAAHESHRKSWLRKHKRIKMKTLL